MRLVIVESPTKSKTISKFLGKEYKIESSFGHIRDLPKNEMGVDIENDFTPKYVVPLKAKKRISELKKLAKKSEEIILATDEDREGEAIAWHLAHALGIKIDETKRIVFHEITKSSIQEAINNPRSIDLDLVDAQQARRILDRLVGYELSPLLWKKIRRGLSAGRVQSVALRLIAEREREIEKFQKEAFWKINIHLRKKTGSGLNPFEATLLQKNGKKIEETITLNLFAGEYKTKKTIFSNKKSAQEALEDLEKSNFSVRDISQKETTKTPPPPFTTSTLQQAAINNFGYSSKQTMAIAQKLYEEGYITYMRTDSVNLSSQSLSAAQKIIQEKFGKEYALENPRYYKNRAKGAQEAHEAIRPAYPEKTPDEIREKLEPRAFKLYRLIWQRMIASQMQPAIFNSVKVDVIGENTLSKNKYDLRAGGSTLQFEGYLKVYDNKNNFDEPLLPAMKKDDELEISLIETEEKSTTPPPRYNEAALVKVMEENGIGRPSTYAPTISTIIDRKYVDKNEEKRLYPLEVGLLVNDLLVAHFPEIVDIKFTAHIEEDFDQIAEGKMSWIPTIKEFYTPFHKNIEIKLKEIKKEDLLEKLDRQCPECDGDLIVKFGRFGKFIACANFPKCKYTEKTEEEKKIDEENSGEICEQCGAPMVVKRGRFGAFLGCSNYPECRNIKKIENKTGIKCPQCQEGEIVERRSKKGRSFYGCNKYPKCKFALWSKPTGESCPTCQSPLVFAAKGKIRCSNKECKFEQ